MTLDHVAKVGNLIFPVKRVASDGSLILALPNGGMLRLAPGAWREDHRNKQENRTN